MHKMESTVECWSQRSHLKHVSFHMCLITISVCVIILFFFCSFYICRLCVVSIELLISCLLLFLFHVPFFLSPTSNPTLFRMLFDSWHSFTFHIIHAIQQTTQLRKASQKQNNRLRKQKENLNKFHQSFRMRKFRQSLYASLFDRAFVFLSHHMFNGIIFNLFQVHGHAINGALPRCQNKTWAICETD